MHFRLIGRKKFFTAGRVGTINGPHLVGPLLPPGKHALLRGAHSKKETDRVSLLH